MTRHPRLRLLSPVVAVALVAVALGACQPVKEPPPGECTQFWRGYVLASDHNYAGLGAFTGSDRYMCKPTPWQGVRAQIQHLRNYADASSTHTNLGHPFEPRVNYDAAAFNSFPFKGAANNLWVGLNGKWAVPGTTYGQKILGICNNMRVSYDLYPETDTDARIMGPPLHPNGSTMPPLTDVQIGQYVTTTLASTGNTWKPEIGPTDMAQLFIDEGNAAGVRGDIAFCQSLLETAWFAWPNSYGYSVDSVDEVEAAYLELQQSTYRH